MVAKVKRTIKEIDWDLNVDLKPCMDVLTVLIPFLVVFASFAAVKILEVNLPEINDTQVAPPKDKEDEGLLLTVIISDNGLTLGARGAILPTTYTQEYHRYEYQYPAGAASLKEFLQKINSENKKVLPFCPEDKKRQLTLVERAEIILYVVEKANETDTGTEVKALFDKAGTAFTNSGRVILSELPRVGDTVFALSVLNPVREVVVNPANYHLGKLTAYDQLASRLIRIQSMYPSVPDQGEIKIIAEDDVMFDKIIHVMDVCRDFGYQKISLGKLAG